MSTPFVGEIRLFAFPRIPEGWLACDGSLQPISQYEVLYTLLGTTFGGNGQTTFGIPDMRGQVPLHQGTGVGLTPRLLGQFGGSETIALVAGSMPAHNHPYATTSTLANATTPATNVQLGALASGDNMYATTISGLNPFAMSPASTAAAGGSQSHDNTMPTLTVSFCIAYAGIFPSQS